METETPDLVAAPPNAEDPIRPEHHDTESWRRNEVVRAIKNAVKLGTSLLFTWAIGLVLRLYIPRFLGPDRFGALNFADAFAATAFVFIDLGITTYVRKEIAVRPKQASEFIGGVVITRVALTFLLYAGMELILRLTHRSPEIRLLVYVFGLGQFFIVGSSLSSALLHATGNVNEMSVVTMVTKVVWAACLGAALVFRLDLWVFALALCLSEGLKSSVLYYYARKYLELEFHFDAKATWRALAGGMPFYVSGIATAIYNRIDVSILGVLTTDREVGWYGASVTLAGLTMLLAPLIGWVLMPLLSRAAKQSDEELFSLSRRSLELILTVAICASFAMVIGADFWIVTVFGQAFAPAIRPMQLLSIAHVLMYASIIYWCILTMLERTWRVTAVFLIGLVVNPTLNFLIIRPGVRILGDGGGGTAAAASTLITELLIVGALASMAGRRGIDRRLVFSVGKLVGVAALIITADRLWFVGFGPIRLAIEIVVFPVVALLTGALNLHENIPWVREMMQRRRELKAAGKQS